MTTTPRSQALNEGQVLTLFMVQDHGELKFRADWRQQLSEEQKFVVAEAVDKIMRRESKLYTEATEVLDQAAQKWWEVEAHPILGRLIRRHVEGGKT
jgi:hypothetical protein